MTDGHPPLYFLRHGQTGWNQQGLIQGWIDTPLNETGEVQSRAIGRALAVIPELAKGFRFFVSPLRRARQTMDHIANALALRPEQVSAEPAVRELGFGIWEGKPFWELKASSVYPADAENRYGWRPQGGESYADGQQRLSAWLDGLNAPAVVVAHGAIGRCLVGHLCNLRPADLVNLRMPQGQYCRIERGRAQWFDAMEIAA